MDSNNRDLWQQWARSVPEVDTNIQDVARGSVEFEDYLGNRIADMLAKAAAKRFKLDPLTREVLNKAHQIAFMVLVRAAIIESAARETFHTRGSYELAKTTQIRPLHEQSQQLEAAILKKGHQLQKLPNGKVRCSKGQFVRPCV